MSYSFRCKNCGHLVPSGHAGEQSTPRACPVCKAGVEWQHGAAIDRPGNWEILDNATPERLAELGLTAAEIERHTPTPKADNLRAGLQTIAEHQAFLKAKREHWDANKESIAKEFAALNDQYTAFGQQLDAAKIPSEIARLSDERERVYQQMLTLANMEPTTRDDEHEAHLAEWKEKHEKALAGMGGQAKPRMLQVTARDGARTTDRG